VPIKRSAELVPTIVAILVPPALRRPCSPAAGSS
jgi:hypothetical protein